MLVGVPSSPPPVAALPDDALVRHLHRVTGLDEDRCRHLIGEVVAYFDESVEEYVRRRHTELKTYGSRNDAIFEQLRTELADRVVRAPDLSVRQLRRIVYG